jgi:hypothetical protein
MFDQENQIVKCDPSCFCGSKKLKFDLIWIQSSLNIDLNHFRQVFKIRIKKKYQQKNIWNKWNEMDAFKARNVCEFIHTNYCVLFSQGICVFFTLCVCISHDFV